MSLKPKTILVVDDDQDMLALLNRMLTTAGYKVLLANSPENARKSIAIEPPHIILTDLHMVPENGFQFIQSIRSQKQFASVPVLVLSGLNDFGSVKKAIGLGVNDYVVKPLQSQMLIRKIRKALLNKDFSKWEVPTTEDTSVDVLIDTEILSIGDTGLILSAPFKVTTNKEFKLSSPELKELDLDKVIMKSNFEHKAYRPGGLFLNEISFVGIPESTLVKIRKFVSERNS